MGWPTKTYNITEDYAEADDVDGDSIFQQAETTYDAAGNVTFQKTRRRLHDATDLGALTTPGGSQPRARVSQVGYWYDQIGRQTATADYGTETFNRTTQTSSPDWDDEDGALVSTTHYNSDGEADYTHDPKNTKTLQEFDDVGRVTKTIQNDVASPSDPDEDVTVERTYNADGALLTLTAKNSTTGDQVTRYVYGTAVGGITPLVYSNDLLRAEIYPDSDDTTDGATTLGNGGDGLYDRIEFKYNRQGQRIELKDQIQTVHAHSYDALGRLTEDKVTLAQGSDIDDAVLRIERSYEVRGMVETITSYDAATAGNVVNDVELEYNDFAQVSKDYQEHEGAKDANTLKVQYAYTDGSGNHSRLTGVTYPNARVLHHEYSSGDDSSLSRISYLSETTSGGTRYAEYTYLGLGTMVVEDFTQPDVKLDYFGGTSGTYAGFDRFGRVVDQKWTDYGPNPDVDRDRYTYGYDRASNRLYKENVGPSGKDEYYTYDGIYRLKNFDRGDLNQDKTAISGTPGREEDFTLDPTGNWSGFVEKTSGTTDLNQSRDQNKVNEITDITETTGTAWITPVQDKAGNMTTVPKPSSLANGLTCKYDAWNRLVEVTDDETVVAKYEYDGSGRRIKKHLDSQSPGNPNGIDKYEHFFYSGVQLVETRDTTTENDQPENLQPDYQYVWSLRYIDAAILRDQNTDQDSLCDDQRLYYLTDANFNVTTLIDTAGDACERYLYNPYGKVTIYDATWANTRNTSSYNNQVLFTGRRLDAETGIYYYRARYYTVDLCRFISREPVGLLSNMSLYVYVSNQPTQAMDPSGYDYIGIKKGTENVVQWMPEGWFWINQPAGAFDLGTVDKDGVVTFNPGLGLAPMPLNVLDNYGGANSIRELLAAIREAQNNNEKNIWSGGRSKSDYWHFRVTCEECYRGEVEAEKRCNDAITVAAGAHAGTYLGYTTGESLIATAFGGAATVGYLNSWNPWGVGLSIGASAGLYVKAGLDYNKSQQAKKAATTAVKEYCDCDKFKNK